MSPAEWEAKCGQDIHWSKAYAAIEAECRRALGALPEERQIATTDLVELVYPIATVRGSLYVRNRIFRALLAKNNGKPVILEDCRTLGAERRIHGGVKACPWFWHRPIKKVICCPNCQFEWEAD